MIFALWAKIILVDFNLAVLTPKAKLPNLPNLIPNQISGYMVYEFCSYLSVFSSVAQLYIPPMGTVFHTGVPDTTLPDNIV